MHRLPLVLTVVASAWGGRVARADDGETIVIEDTRPAEPSRDRARALTEAPFVTVIHPDEHGAAATVADAAAEAPGVQVRSLGGLGSYQSVSIRGTASGNTTVLVDGVPLARLAAVTTDLGKYALDAFARVEIYRGAVPVALGGAGVGGAVNLVSRVGRAAGDPDAPPVGATIGIGSWGARHARVHYGDDLARAWRGSFSLGYAHADGGFPFFDNHGTQLNPRDDTVETRRNNAFTQVDGVARIAHGRESSCTAGSANRADPASGPEAAATPARAPSTCPPDARAADDHATDGGLRVRATDDDATDDVGGLRVAYRTQGLPGSTNQPTSRAGLRTLDAIADAHATRAFGDTGADRGTASAYALVERQHLDDPAGELGLGAQARASTTLSAGATAAVSAHASAPGLVDDALATLGAELRADRFADDDDGGASGTSGTSGPSGTHGDRITGAILADAALALAPDVVVTPAIRLDVARTAPAALTVGPTAFAPVPARVDVLPSPRLTARLSLAADLALKASGGWYARQPTLVELFGNRGFILGTPDLKPERGPTGDLGGVYAPTPRAAAAIDRVLVEADVFATRANDTIGYITTAGGFITRAANLGRTQTYGTELAATARLARTLTLVASYTHLATAQITDDVDLAGRALPRTPRDRAYARATLARVLGGRALSAWGDVAYQGTAYLDPANLGQVPARALVGIGASAAIAARIVVAISVENLANTRVEQLPLVPPPSPSLAETPVALADLANYPLPGRSYYLSLAWNH